MHYVNEHLFCMQGPSLKRDKSGLQSGGVWPSEDFQPEAEDSSKKTATTSERDEMASAAGHTAGPTQAKGKATGQALQKNLDTKVCHCTFSNFQKYDPTIEACPVCMDATEMPGSREETCMQLSVFRTVYT